MNPHLQALRDYRLSCGMNQAEFGVGVHQSDMDIVHCEATLMATGSRLFTALQKGEMADILAGLVALAYDALTPLARQGEDVLVQPVPWRHDGTILSIMKLLADKIGACASGHSADYSALYCACRQLASAFLNADFNKAMKAYLNFLITCDHREGESVGLHAVDLSECLFE